MDSETIRFTIESDSAVYYAPWSTPQMTIDPGVLLFEDEPQTHFRSERILKRPCLWCLAFEDMKVLKEVAGIDDHTDSIIKGYCWAQKQPEPTEALDWQVYWANAFDTPHYEWSGTRAFEVSAMTPGGMVCRELQLDHPDAIVRDLTEFRRHQYPWCRAESYFEELTYKTEQEKMFDRCQVQYRGTLFRHVSQ